MLQPQPLPVPEPVIKTVTEYKTLEIYQPPLPKAIDLRDVEFFVLTEKNNAMQQEMDGYLSIFKRHDMTRLARAKPGLIEPRINKGTKAVFRSIEEASVEVENADSQ